MGAVAEDLSRLREATAVADQVAALSNLTAKVESDPASITTLLAEGGFATVLQLATARREDYGASEELTLAALKLVNLCCYRSDEALAQLTSAPQLSVSLTRLSFASNAEVRETAVQMLRLVELVSSAARWRSKFVKNTAETLACAICQDDFVLDDEVITLPCGHMFHWNESREWFAANPSCPVCRVGLLPAESVADYRARSAFLLTALKSGELTEQRAGLEMIGGVTQFTDELVDRVLQLLAESPAYAVRRLAVEAVGRAAEHDRGAARRVGHAAGALTALCDYAGHDVETPQPAEARYIDETLRQGACRALLSLCVEPTASHQIMATAGGPQALYDGLGAGPGMLREVAAGWAWNVCTHEVTRGEFVNSGAMSPLIDCLGDGEQTTFRACMAFAYLLGCPALPNVDTATRVASMHVLCTEAGATALARALRLNSDRVTMAAMSAIVVMAARPQPVGEVPALPLGPLINAVLDTVPRMELDASKALLPLTTNELASASLGVSTARGVRRELLARLTGEHVGTTRLAAGCIWNLALSASLRGVMLREGFAPALMTVLRRGHGAPGGGDAETALRVCHALTLFVTDKLTGAEVVAQMHADAHVLAALVRPEPSADPVAAQRLGNEVLSLMQKMLAMQVPGTVAALGSTELAPLLLSRPQHEIAQYLLVTLAHDPVAAAALRADAAGLVAVCVGAASSTDARTRRWGAHLLRLVVGHTPADELVVLVRANAVQLLIALFTSADVDTCLFAATALLPFVAVPEGCKLIHDWLNVADSASFVNHLSPAQHMRSLTAATLALVNALLTKGVCRKHFVALMPALVPLLESRLAPNAGPVLLVLTAEEETAGKIAAAGHVPGLVAVMTTPQGAGRAIAAGCLWNLSLFDASAVVVVAAGGTTALLAALADPEPEVIGRSLVALRHLVSKNEASRAQTLRSAAAIVTLLKHSDQGVRQIAEQLWGVLQQGMMKPD